MKKSRFKKVKMGDLPGDFSKGIKIAMLEKRIDTPCAKSFRNDHKKRAERKFRYSAREEIENFFTA